MGRLRVAVLMGGRSTERDVSLSTGTQILKALDPARYDAFAAEPIHGLSPDVPSLVDIAALPPAERPDVVMIALHGPGGEDGTVQGMLDVLGIPYTGSGVLASAVANDKAMAKRVLQTAGVRFARGITLHSSADVDHAQLAELGLPCVVKPNCQGSTIGMTVVRDAAAWDEALATAFALDDTVLVEQFVAGTEITVPILGTEVLPVVELVPKSGFYDYESKYTVGATEEIVPARLSEAATAEAQQIAQTCHRTLGCRGMSRTDMIVDAHGDIYTLEVNSIPGMTPTSSLPVAAQAAGISFPALLDRLISMALDPA